MSLFENIKRHNDGSKLLTLFYHQSDAIIKRPINIRMNVNNSVFSLITMNICPPQHFICSSPSKQADAI